VSNTDSISSNLIIVGESDDFLMVIEKDSLTDKFWKTESIGIFNPESNDDAQQCKFLESIHFTMTTIQGRITMEGRVSTILKPLPAMLR
jgi:hypothetical protein